MKKLILIFFSAIIVNAWSISAKQLNDADTIVIDSDSQVGIRALQGGPVQTAKIILQNAGSSLLTNVKLNLLNPPADVTLGKKDCGDSLKAGKTCYYLVNYQPARHPTKQNTKQFITFIASAENGNVVTKDSYTMVIESFVNQDPSLSKPMNFIPTGDLMKGFKKAKVDLLYATGKVPMGLSADSVLLRSTDGWHWSVVGANWNELAPVVENIKDVNLDSQHNLLLVYSTKQNALAGIARYNGTKWQASPVEAGPWQWQNNPKIKVLLDSTQLVPGPVLITPTGDLYLGYWLDHDDRHDFGVLKFNGHHWELSSEAGWLYGPVNSLHLFDGVLYAAASKGVVKFDGKAWLNIGKFPNAAWNFNPEISDLLQTEEGDLYAFSPHHGVMRYDQKNNLWHVVGPNMEIGDPGYSSFAYYDKNLYISDDSGVNLYNPKTNQWDEVKTDGKDIEEYNSKIPDGFEGMGGLNTIIGLNEKFLFLGKHFGYDALFRFDSNRWVRLKL